jgi:hypothetical protein
MRAQVLRAIGTANGLSTVEIKHALYGDGGEDRIKALIATLFALEREGVLRRIDHGDTCSDWARVDRLVCGG